MTNFKVIEVKTDEQKAKLFSIRREVFVVEQEVAAEEEFDEFEDTSFHFVALDSSQEAIGSARWRETAKGCKLERFAVKQSWRRKGVASALVQAVLTDIDSKKGAGNYLYMHAQLDAIPLYEKFGFEKKGEMFEECNIQHYTMYKTI
jgi:predicted GNAT family N-acyltransferase